MSSIVPGNLSACGCRLTVWGGQAGGEPSLCPPSLGEQELTVPAATQAFEKQAWAPVLWRLFPTMHFGQHSVGSPSQSFVSSIPQLFPGPHKPCAEGLQVGALRSPSLPSGDQTAQLRTTGTEPSPHAAAGNLQCSLLGVHPQRLPFWPGAPGPCHAPGAHGGGWFSKVMSSVNVA